MSDTLQSIKDDLDFMKTLAAGDAPEEARRSGAILLASGTLFGGASLGAFAVTKGWLPTAAINPIWIGSTLVFLAVLTLNVSKKSRSAGLRDRATGLAWGGVGGSIFSIFLGMYVVANVLKDGHVFALAPTVVLDLYGAAWTVAASMSGRLWMRVVAIASYVFAVGIGALASSPVVFLAYAGTLVLLAVLPGVALLSRKG